MSDAWGSFVPVLAQSRRCGRAPALKARCPRVQPLRGGECGRGVVSQQRRDLERYPAVDTTCPLPDGPKQVRGAREVLEGQLEEQVFTRLAFLDFLANGRVVAGAVLDRVVEDRGVGRQTRHGVLVDVARERAALEQFPCDVVEPETLAAVV